MLLHGLATAVSITSNQDTVEGSRFLHSDRSFLLGHYATHPFSTWLYGMDGLDRRSSWLLLVYLPVCLSV